MTDKLKLLDLFSGIGGFSLGLERTGGFETVAFCEIEEYPRKVLARHWPEVRCYNDVRELNADTLARDGIEVDVITGGFPCQDISVAGKRAGISGETRSGLWSEIVRLIDELSPRIIIVENVANLLRGPSEKPGGWFGRVLGDLAERGYDAEWENIPASAVGATHRRERVWVVAYTDEKLRGVMAESFKIRSSNLFAQGLEKGSIHRPDCLSVPLGRAYANPRGGGIRNDNGIPTALDRIGALGNAVVPQIPEIIGNAILKNMMTHPYNGDMVSRKTTYEVGDPEGDRDND